MSARVSPPASASATSSAGPLRLSRALAASISSRLLAAVKFRLGDAVLQQQRDFGIDGGFRLAEIRRIAGAGVEGEAAVIAGIAVEAGPGTERHIDCSITSRR